MKSFLRFLLLLLILAVGFASLAIYWTFYKPLPDYNATVSIPELNEPVTIYWDDYGVPGIFANNEADLYRALGYVHAQDRLWQMTVSSLFAQGRFSEFLGRDLLELDKFSRTIGFWRIAGELESQLPEEDHLMLTSYTEGINRFISDNRNRLPIEFSLTGIQPEEWTPRHTLAISRLLGWELNVSWWSKVMLGFLEDYLDRATLEELFPRWPADGPRNLNPAETRQLLSNLMPLLESDLAMRKLTGNAGSHIGSNAWVASGTRTQSGYPILAGDPHLGLDIPGKWYEVHLNLNGRSVSGASIPGAPVIVIGQNDHHAWSITSLMSDDTDFFIERVNPLDRGQYLADSTATESGGWRQFEIKRELLKTREGEEVLHEIRLTQHGPVINDVYPTSELTSNHYISMRWTGAIPGNELGAFRRMAWADNFHDFQQALQLITVPGLNVMYADRSGNIAMITAGKLPVRMDAPLTFRQGWNPSHHWTSYIPPNHMPRVINPASGYIANANNPVVSDNYPYYITSFWEPDSRIRRIEEVLGNSAIHTIALYQELQNDVYSHQAADITAIILPVLRHSTNPDVAMALPYLKNWDFNYSENATAASLMEAFFLNLTEHTFRNYLGDAAYSNFIKLENFPVRVLTRMLNEGSVWMQSNYGNTAYRDSLIELSMRDAVISLREDFGNDPAGWMWGNVHTLTLGPLLFREAVKDPDASAVLKSIVNNVMSRGPYPVGGHSMTVNNTQYDWSNPYGQVLGASIRRIVDLSDLNQSFSILPTGQSGNPLSRHYGDQTDLWISGKYRIFRHHSFISDDVRIRTMLLNPQ